MNSGNCIVQQNYTPYRQENNSNYYIDTDEIPGFFFLLKNHIFIACSEDTIFTLHVWGYWCRHGY